MCECIVIHQSKLLRLTTMFELCLPFVVDFVEFVKKMVRTPSITEWQDKHLIYPMTANGILLAAAAEVANRERYDDPGYRTVGCMKLEIPQQSIVMNFYRSGIPDAFNFKFLLESSDYFISREDCNKLIIDLMETHGTMVVQHDARQDELLITFGDEKRISLADYPIYDGNADVTSITIFGLTRFSYVLADFLNKYINPDANQIWRVTLTNICSKSNPAVKWSSEATLLYNHRQAQKLLNIHRTFSSFDDERRAPVLPPDYRGDSPNFDDEFKGGRKTRTSSAVFRSRSRLRAKKTPSSRARK